MSLKRGKRRWMLGLEAAAAGLLALMAERVAGLGAPAGADREANTKPMAPQRQVAILIFEGVQIIDFTGPYEVFGHAGYSAFTVAEKPGPITTSMGITVVPRYTFDSSPPADILVVPGGNVPSVTESAKAVAWVKSTASKTPIVLSVCNGAFILARAGLLDGLEATTFAALIDDLAKEAPRTRVVRDKRFVDNGHIITSAGLSSGIDGALHVIERLDGKGTAQVAATGMEYNWDPESRYVRAALADRYLRSTYPFLHTLPRRILSYEGTSEHWEGRWLVESDVRARQLLTPLEAALTTEGHWRRQEGKAAGPQVGAGAASHWRFDDERGRSWRGLARVEAAPGEKGKLLVTLRVELGAG
ncbi:MAG TPA: DJ-1/PfpI family protein [Thermoanaerobaculia bacterium]|nr:DJ-1/PfpI family protein [Thermoanaerobaculia bacterium]